MSYHIQVCCRLRSKDRKNELNRSENPLEDSEEDFIKVVNPNDSSQVNQTKEPPDKSSPIISVNNKTNFSIDQVFENSSQHEIFEQSLEPMLQDLFKGIHCTLFTYGQTGSGKTYTVIGGDKEERGLLPRAVEYIFNRIASSSIDTSSEAQKLLTQQTIVKLSFIEIYHEKLHDLLSVHYQPHKQPAPSSSCLSEDYHALAIRQSSDGTIFVENIQEITIQSFEEFQKYLNVALKKRMVGSHRMNEYSSRSHLCCLIDLIQYQHPTSQVASLSLTSTTKSLRKLHSKLSIIDLAGSEMARKTEASGQRFQEAKFINKSLSALSKVIGTLAVRYEQQSAITANSTLGGESAHIPYRDSKLTRLLQNSLGGNSKTIIILTVSRNKDHIPETISTLKFGERARLIKITPQINSLASTTGPANQISADATHQTKELEDTISQLKDQVLSLNQIISDLRNDQVSSSHSATSSSSISNNNAEFSHEFSTNYSTSLCHMCRRVINDDGGLGFNSFQKKEDPDQDQDQDQGALDESEEEEEEEVEEEAVVERCAICGLNADETENLKHLTNEDLGFLFSCDGNCGNKFHIRCVGVVGEGGQFTLPEGEWFCNDCTVQLSEVAIQKEKDEQLQHLKTLSPIKTANVKGPSHRSPSSNENEAESKSDNTEGNTNTSTNLPIQLHPPTNNHYKEVLIYMNLITSLQQKFNLMRKERNRILNHFQNEKKMFQQLENLRNQKIEVLVSKNLSLQEEKESFEDTIKQLKKQNKFLQHQLQQYEKQQLQQRLLSHNGNSTSSSSKVKVEGVGPHVTSSSAHHSTDWISFTDSQELQHVLHGLYLSSSTNQIEEGRKDAANEIVHQVSFSPRPSSSTSSSSLQVTELNRVSNKVEGVLEHTNSNDENYSDNVRRSSFLQHRKQISQNMIDQSALLTSLSSRINRNDDEDVNEDQKVIPKPWVKPPSSIATTKIPTKPNINHNEATPVQTTTVGEPSRFVNPLKNRISELLDLVEEEKHSFQEIRYQFQQHQQQKKYQIGQARPLENSER